ncbi:MAG: hypothetical protein JNM79_18985 [Burkholderiales bacterium]|nr:hypothetical protein [Burkholderiales bacterium]
MNEADGYGEDSCGYEVRVHAALLLRKMFIDGAQRSGSAATRQRRTLHPVVARHMAPG